MVWPEQVRESGDAVGNRTAMTDTTGVPEMLSDGERLYLIAQETLGWADGAAWRYPLGDALGSVRQVVDGGGAVLDDRSWTPFGVEEGTAQGGLG